MNACLLLTVKLQTDVNHEGVYGMNKMLEEATGEWSWSVLVERRVLT